MSRAHSIIHLCEQNYKDCPVCGSNNIEDTDNGSITPTQITQEFKCHNPECGARWEVEYQPIRIYGIVKGDEDE